MSTVPHIFGRRFDVLTSRQKYVTITFGTDNGYSVSKDQSSKKNTSLRLESNMLKALKIRAIEEDTSVQVILERLVEEYLNNSKKLEKTKK